MKSPETIVELGVQGESFMTIRSTPVPFDAARLYETGIRVDDNPVIVRLSKSADGRTLTFSEEDSITLHRQFEAGSVITVTLVFAGLEKPVTQAFSLDGYRAVAAQYKGCRGLLMNPGWLGVSMTAIPDDKNWLSWIKNNTPYHTSGIQIITVDPRKAASRGDIRPGDRIIGFNGQGAEVKDLIRLMKNLGVGRSIELDMVRDWTRFKKTITRPVGTEKGE